MFKRILVANRSEIAVRIIRAAREMGIETVSIYHEVDRESPYVHYADYAYEVFAKTPKAAYLDIPQVIDVAQKSCSEAIHPGYGFLSENSKFSRAVADAGIKFIGPPPGSIESMGNKTQARRIMADAGVPIVPGTKERIEDIGEALKLAEEMGFPVLLKAAAGGGGKGMRRVDKAEDFVDAFEGASREAANAFGDDTVYLEKYILNPKHIEMQVLGDEHGNYVHLCERDCSIQRRHQKVIEEAPSTVLDEELRRKMGEVAVNAARACGYTNAGTIEFLFDKDRNFYFLEMNTRLQVEHPVTEMITKIDLAKAQIRIANGEKLWFGQDDVKIHGHAIECRVYAEDPFNNFLPDTGKIKYLRPPGGHGVRVDSGIETNSEINIHFDPMISKLVTWGNDRKLAIKRMERALLDYRVVGLRTVIPFHIAVMRNKVFTDGYFDTAFIEKDFDFDVLKQMQDQNEELIAALAAYAYRMEKDLKISDGYRPQISKWKEKNLFTRRLI